jgi:DNA adenine methylase
MLKPKVMGIAPWFGSKRTLAPEIVRQLGSHVYYFGGCCGSLSVEMLKEPCEHESVCDLHGALTNLAWVVQREELAVQLFNELQRVAYHDELYQVSKDWLDGWEATEQEQLCDEPSVDWAYHYFIASWMGRNGVAGTSRINYQIATRWTQGGGSGPLRFKSAVASIPGWWQRLRNIHVLRRDVFHCLEQIEDASGVAIYTDPPYLLTTRSGRSSRYVHDFTDADHERLATALCRFRHARVVTSYYADPRLSSWYPGWTMVDCSRQKHLHVQNKRGMGRFEAPEVLLINGAAYQPEKESLF